MAGTLDADLRAAAAERPEHTAVVARGQRLTYGELDERVERLARTLRGLGVVCGDRVAVIMRNSAEAAVAIYATLRAGTATALARPATERSSSPDAA